MATNRRDALMRGFALLGAAIGIGAASDAPAGARESEASPKKQMVLHARLLRIHSRDLRRGELPTPGVRMMASAEIVAGPSSVEKMGDFLAAYHRVNAPGKAARHEPGSLEQHTFVLPEGNLFGTGVGSSGMESEGQFAIVGGTGRYAGAQGSYVARQSHLDFGGNGTATFTFTLV